MKTIKIVLFSAALFVSVTTMKAQTPSCSSATAAVTTMWEKFGEWNADITTAFYQTKVNQAVRAWNQAAHNNWATLGPRSLKLNQMEKGTILGQTNRTFVMPPSYRRNLSITIKKTDGRAKMGVTICTTGRSGRKNIVAQYTFPNGRHKLSKTFNISGARGKVISINMRNYSVGNKFKYKISAQ